MGEFLQSFDSVFYILHWVASALLIVTILLQAGKGMDIGAMFGAGNSQSVFGARGADNFLTKLTTLVAVVFLFTSISLSTIANYKEVGGASVIPDEPTINASQKETDSAMKEPLNNSDKKESEQKSKEEKKN